jgi:hypothetical protein
VIVSPTIFVGFLKKQPLVFAHGMKAQNTPKSLQHLNRYVERGAPIQLQEIDLRQFSSASLPNYPSYLAHGMKAQNIPESQQHLNRDVKTGAKSNSMNFSPT